MENDPLGALLDSEKDEILELQPNEQVPEIDEKQLEKQRIQTAMYSDQPILFKGHRSATFDESSSLSKNMHRSETMPMSSFSSGFASLSSSLKFGFG